MTTITADADKVSPRQFLDGLGLSSPEIRAARREHDKQSCKRAILRGDTYGYPPMLVDQVRAEMAAEQAETDDLSLAPVVRVSPTQVAA